MPTLIDPTTGFEVLVPEFEPVKLNGKRFTPAQKGGGSPVPYHKPIKCKGGTFVVARQYPNSKKFIMYCAETGFVAGPPQYGVEAAFVLGLHSLYRRDESRVVRAIQKAKAQRSFPLGGVS